MRKGVLGGSGEAEEAQARGLFVVRRDLAFHPLHPRSSVDSGRWVGRPGSRRGEDLPFVSSNRNPNVERGLCRYFDSIVAL